MGAFKRMLMRMAMVPLWAAASWKSYMPRLYAGRRPADFDDYRDKVVARLRKPGYAKAFSLTTRTNHDPAEARLAKVSVPTTVVMGDKDPDFPDPAGEASWIAGQLNGGKLGTAVKNAEVVMAAEAGHYPQSQQPEITIDAVLRLAKAVNRVA
jgi:pimeloyl-ACP methyl ester carboxylesterase